MVSAVKPFDRAIWLCGLAAIVAVVVYWPTVVSAYRNRKAIAAVSNLADAYNGLRGA
jgi:uncharacterized membrane protein